MEGDLDSTIDELVTAVQHSRKIVVLTGAGISVHANIPDFRSPGVGLYAVLGGFTHFMSPTSFFSIGQFRKDSRPFWWLFNRLWRSAQPDGRYPDATPFHKMMAKLATHNLVRRIYTQNVDGLELAAGVEKDLLVNAHGHLQSAHCIDCRAEVTLEQCLAAVLQNDPANKSWEGFQVPICPRCGKDKIKPDVVFFGECLPPRFNQLVNRDMRECDLLIVAGTSLEVQPVCGIVEMVPAATKRFVISLTRPASSWWDRIKRFFGGVAFDYGNGRDYLLQGDCQIIATELVKRLGWDDHEG